MGLHEFKHNLQNPAAQQTASAARYRAREASRSVEVMEQRMQRLLLACNALWSLLQDHTELTDADLLKRMDQIDLQDGNLDGNINKSTVNCPSCQRVMSPHHRYCLYCGTEKPAMNPFLEI